MLTKFKIHLEMEGAYPSSGNAQCKFPSFRSSSKEDAMVAGLQSLVRGSLSEGSRRCNVVFKSSLKTHRLPAATKFQYCFLKSCHLCNKRLSQDKDIYMYRGDIGFCSVECRRQQIEMDELMASSSTSRALRSHRHCSVAARRQTRPPIPSNASDHGLLSWD